MRFEKLNDNKIRITLNSEDLLMQDIDFHGFMSNSIQSQSLFFDMLDRAEKEIGFSTKDYLVRVDVLALTSGDFILTITRSLPPKVKNIKRISRYKSTMHANNKINKLNMIYLFDTFDDFYTFIEFYNKTFSYTNIAQKVILYEYNNSFYLLLNKINCSFMGLKQFFSSITEFAKPIHNSLFFEYKIVESGKIIMKHNAISIGIKSFIKRA